MDTSNITFYGADSWNKKNSFEYDPVSFDPKIIPERDRARKVKRDLRARLHLSPPALLYVLTMTPHFL